MLPSDTPNAARMFCRCLGVLMLGLTAVLSGCKGNDVFFPAQSLDAAAKSAGAAKAYDLNADGKADFFYFADATGRVTRIAYARDRSGAPDRIVDLDAISFAQCRHMVIILDGFGYDVVKEFYDQGHLRMCYPPSRVIAPYPTLTDLCLEDALGYVPCPGFEARYYDHQAQCVRGGSWDYMHSANEPYNKLLDYRAGLIWDGVGYLYPEWVFRREMRQSAGDFNDADKKEWLAYYISSSAMGTILGAEGQRKCLVEVERLINQAMWQTNGLLKITIFADHGHSYTPSTQIPLDTYLEGKGWNITECLRKPNDVVYIRYGLETYASFATNDAKKLAEDLAKAEGVDLVSYADGDSVVVLEPRYWDGPAEPRAVYAAKAVIRRKGNRYRYEYWPESLKSPDLGHPGKTFPAPKEHAGKDVTGDVLGIQTILNRLKPDADGYYDEDELFQATVQHEYPDALARLWRAHFGLAEHTPDVIVSLKDNYFSGSKTFGKLVKIASTHGSLNRKNSTTFIMSSAGPLPPALRSADIPKAMKQMTGESFPLGK